jgi:hypothetical protein
MWHWLVRLGEHVAVQTWMPLALAKLPNVLARLHVLLALQQLLLLVYLLRRKLD